MDGYVFPMRAFVHKLSSVALAHSDVLFHSPRHLPPSVKFCHTYSYKFLSRGFPSHVNCRGLMLLIWLAGDISLNPGLVLGVANIPSITNKGALIVDTTASHDFNFFCLSETYIRSSVSAGLIDSVTSPGYVFLHQPCLSGRGGGVRCLIKQSYHPLKIDLPS